VANIACIVLEIYTMLSNSGPQLTKLQPALQLLAFLAHSVYLSQSECKLKSNLISDHHFTCITQRYVEPDYAFFSRRYDGAPAPIHK